MAIVSASAKIALISGSTRTGSINSKTVKAMSYVFKDMGAKTSIINLDDYEMPLYNGDWEAENGQPKTTKKLINRLKKFDGVVISTPEYNGGLPPLLKNTIDWTTRITTDHFKGPVYGILATSPGPMSGIMALRDLRFLLARLGANVVPAQVGVGNAHEAFTDKGRFNEGRAKSGAENLADQVLTEIARRI